MTNQHVHIQRGYFRNKTILDKTYPMVKPVSEGAYGQYVTVNPEDDADFRNMFPVDKNPSINYSKARIRVEDGDFRVFVPGDDIDDDDVKTYQFKIGGHTVSLYENEYDDDVANVIPMTGGGIDDGMSYADRVRMDEIKDRFSILETFTTAIADGQIASAIVTGPPGMGKSHGIWETLNKTGTKYEVVKGTSTALGLYMKLYEYREKGNVIVMDDCDAVFGDELMLNIMKAALDTSLVRSISWNTTSSKLTESDVPNSFEFEGSVIFITNINFENVRSKKIQDHLKALESRSFYLDLTIHTVHDKLLRIRQIARDNGLFKEFDFSDAEKKELVDFMQDNADSLREISLRAAIKLAKLKKVSPDNWKDLAKITC